MGQALERHGPHRLAQQLPALLDLIGRDVVHATELGMLVVVFGICLLDLREDRIGGPGLARRPRLRRQRQPQLEPLVGGVGGEQAVQRGGAGPGQPGHEQRPPRRHLRVLGITPPGRLTEQPGDQRVAQEHPAHLAAQRGQLLVGGVGLQQHRQPVPVLVGAEVVKPGQPGRRGVQVIDRADAGPRPGAGRPVRPAPPRAGWLSVQWWYSPQFTSMHCPVIARASDEARKTTVSAISSGSGSRRRSMFAAVSS